MPKHKSKVVLTRPIVLSLIANTNNPVCKCCSIGYPFELTIDHKDGNGNIHRNQVYHTSTWRIIAKELRDGMTIKELRKKYQVLCSLCNHELRIKNKCPHKTYTRKKLKHVFF
jgi:hypothetical protein